MNDCYNCESPICKCDNEVFSAKKKKNGKGQRKTNKYERKRKYKEKLMRTLDIEREPDDYLYGPYGAKFSSYYPVCYSTFYRRQNTQKPHLRRWWYGNKFFKNYANRKVRRYKKKILMVICIVRFLIIGGLFIKEKNMINSFENENEFLSNFYPSLISDGTTIFLLLSIIFKRLKLLL